MSHSLLIGRSIGRSCRHSRPSKRAQIKMFETIGVLVVFMIIVAIGLQFYGRIQQQSLEDMKNKFQQFDSVKMSLLVSHLPELICTSRDIVEGACFDHDKLIIFADHEVDKHDLYVELLGDSVVWVDIVYPVEQTFVIYNGTVGDDYTFTLTPHPVNIYNSSSRTYMMGVLYVQKNFATVDR